MKLTFLDFETTWLIKQWQDMPLVIQAALKIVNWKEKSIEINEFYWNNNERLNVAVRTETWIQEKDIKDKQLFKDSELLQKLIKNQNWTVFVAHNWIDFDFKIIEHLGFKPKYYIDTLKIALALIQNQEDYDLLEHRYKLWYLRFFLQDKWLLDKKYVKSKLRFHTADYDVETLEQVFNWLVKIYKEKNPNKTEKEILLDFVNISLNPILLKFVWFWKHADDYFNNLPVNYLKWCFENLKWERGSDFDYTIEYYLKQKNPRYFWITEVKQETYINVETNKIETSKIENSQSQVTPTVEIDVFPTPVISDKKLEDSEIDENMFNIK